jgi:hypothetical protein
MLQKLDYVRYAGEGGLYLWDSECQVQWHNLSASDRTDWMLFFDVCREEPTTYTEAIIAAIMEGLCPHKTSAIFEKTRAGTGGQAGRDWSRVKVWYLRQDAAGFGKDSVPEFTRKPAAYFLGQRMTYDAGYPVGTKTFLTPIAHSYGGWGALKRFRRRAWKVHKFDHYFDAWRFLFQFI